MTTKPGKKKPNKLQLEDLNFIYSKIKNNFTISVYHNLYIKLQ